MRGLADLGVGVGQKLVPQGSGTMHLLINFLIFFCCYFETRFLGVTLAVLEVPQGNTRSFSRKQALRSKHLSLQVANLLPDRIPKASLRLLVPASLSKAEPLNPAYIILVLSFILSKERIWREKM